MQEPKNQNSKFRQSALDSLVLRYFGFFGVIAASFSQAPWRWSDALLPHVASCPVSKVCWLNLPFPWALISKHQPRGPVSRKGTSALLCQKTSLEISAWPPGPPRPRGLRRGPFGELPLPRQHRLRPGLPVGHFERPDVL